MSFPPEAASFVSAASCSGLSFPPEAAKTVSEGSAFLPEIFCCLVMASHSFKQLFVLSKEFFAGLHDPFSFLLVATVVFHLFFGTAKEPLGSLLESSRFALDSACVVSAVSVAPSSTAHGSSESVCCLSMASCCVLMAASFGLKHACLLGCGGCQPGAVSYTHLTLPTICSV